MEDIVTIRHEQVSDPALRVGATYVEGQGTHIRLWAPKKESVTLEIEGGASHSLERSEDGYFTGLIPEMKPGDRYYYKADGENIPDPASRFQPDGIKGPSCVVSQTFDWHDDDWKGVPFEDWIIYELHVGTFSEKHTFEGVIDDLPRLRDLGITTLEIMPVSQFPGERNWGYDGVFPHAVQNSYGGPEGLKRLVDACHAHGMAIILDVVYNHLGPEGNALMQCGHYTQDVYKTAWGDALNYDAEHSDHVRRYFLQTVWQWLTEYRFDGLRLDAIQMIYDTSPVPFLEEVSRLRTLAEGYMGRRLILIGETDKNDPRVLAPVDNFGFGFDAHWADDFHHTLHATLTGEQDGYYEIYGGEGQLARVYERGVAFEGEYSPFHKRRHGRTYDNVDKKCLIAETQNHDQIGNRIFGERLAELIDERKRKMASCCLLLSPFTPLIFMGQELGHTAPFLYFTSFLDDELSEAVRKGRAEEWKSFGWGEDPPDPGAPGTFEASVLRGKDAQKGSKEKSRAEYYKTLIRYSKLLRRMSLRVELDEEKKIIALFYGADYLVLLCTHDEDQVFTVDSDDVYDELLCSLSFPERVNEAGKDGIRVPSFSAVFLKRKHA